jgi:hypothetical protein
LKVLVRYRMRLRGEEGARKEEEEVEEVERMGNERCRSAMQVSASLATAFDLCNFNQSRCEQKNTMPPEYEEDRSTPRIAPTRTLVRYVAGSPRWPPSLTTARS